MLNSNTIKLRANAKVKAFAKVFGQYKGRKFTLTVVPDDKEFELVSGWDEGSRDYYALVSMDRSVIRDISEAPFVGNCFNKRPTAFRLEPNQMLVRYSIFMGTETGINFSMPESMAAEFLRRTA